MELENSTSNDISGKISQQFNTYMSLELLDSFAQLFCPCLIQHLVFDTRISQVLSIENGTQIR